MKLKNVMCVAMVIMGLVASRAEMYTGRVNVFLGPASSAQCSPVAIRPFGMISPRPMNRLGVPCGYNNNIKESLGKFRWIVWSVSPVSAHAGGENTAYQELQVECVAVSNAKGES